MSRLRLVIDPNPILRRNNDEIAFPLSKDIRELIDQMCFAVKQFHGIGLAAPQIGRNLHLAVIYLAEYHLPPFPIINPSITAGSGAKIPMEEGCLSLPGKFGVVLRPEKITIAFQDPSGKKIKVKADGLLAKVFQHEVDHLNGRLISDIWDPVTVHTLTDQDRTRLREKQKKLLKK